MECKLCGREAKSLKGLACHVRKSHQEVSIQKYYNMFILTGSENICISPTCENTVSFNNLVLGYRNNTNQKKYCSLSCSMASEAVQEKKALTSTARYGDRNYRNNEQFRKTCLEKHGAVNPLSKGTDASAKRDQTVLLKYGVANVFQAKDVIDKIRSTHEESGRWTDFENISYEDYTEYYRLAWNFFKSIKKKFLSTWDGYDYYDGEYIQDNLNLNSNSPDYPTIDHKMSIKQCLMMGKTPQEASNFDNLCVTKKCLNSQKKCKSEEEFREWLYTKID